MTTLTVDLINPKANKLIKELEGLGLIKISKKTTHKEEDFYVSDSMMKILEQEHDSYKKGIGKNYTRKEVLANCK